MSMPFAFMRLTVISTEIPKTHNVGPMTPIETMTSAEVTPPDPIISQVFYQSESAASAAVCIPIR